jgi:hypothetical protein
MTAATRSMTSLELVELPNSDRPAGMDSPSTSFWSTKAPTTVSTQTSHIATTAPVTTGELVQR